MTVHFGGDPGKPNYLPITPGWNYILRMYRPQEKIINGFWTFPDAKPAAYAYPYNLPLQEGHLKKNKKENIFK